MVVNAANILYIYALLSDYFSMQSLLEARDSSHDASTYEPETESTNVGIKEKIWTINERKGLAEIELMKGLPLFGQAIQLFQTNIMHIDLH